MAVTMSAAQAATTVFTNQATFLSQVQAGYYLETFDSLPLPSTPVSSPQTFSSGGFSYSASATDGLYTAGTGNSDVWLSTNNSTDPIVFNFTSGNVTAVGGAFFPSDINGAFKSGKVTVALNNGTTQQLVNPSVNSFLGFISSTPITSLTVTADNSVSETWPTVNNFIVGEQAVVATPESDLSIPLLGLGLIGLGAGIKRKLGGKK